MVNVAQAIPKTWALATVGDVCSQPQYGYTTKAASIGDLRLLRTSDITSGRISWETVPYCSDNPTDWEKYIVKDGDILVSRAGSIGVSYLVTQPPKAVFASYLIRFKPFIDRQFLAYFLQSPDYWAAIADEKLGIAVPNVNATKLKSITLPLPPTAEQRRIVAKIEELFSELDKGIESLKTAQVQLKVYRQAVLKHAFEGKLTAQWREENKDKIETPEQLLARIKKEREAHYERQLQEWEAAVKKWEEGGKSGRQPSKPQKPKNPLPLAASPVDNPFWTRLFLDELVAEAVLGKMLDREKNTGTPRYYLGNINLRWGKFDLENLKTMKVEESEIERYRLEKGDLVICEGGEPGRCAVWEGQESTMLIQKALHRVRFTESYSPYFAYYFMTYATSAGLLSPNFTGSTIKHLTGKGLGNVLFPLCTLTEQNQIVHLLDRAFNISDELGRQIEREIRRSNSLRQSVLSKAFSGQLVPQDPHDEPASVLLDRIRAEREKVVKSNHAKKTKKRKTTV